MFSTNGGSTAFTRSIGDRDAGPVIISKPEINTIEAPVQVRTPAQHLHLLSPGRPTCSGLCHGRAHLLEQGQFFADMLIFSWHGLFLLFIYFIFSFFLLDTAPPDLCVINALAVVWL